MSLRPRLGRLWESVRPRTRRGGLLAVIAVLAGAGVLSVVLFAGAAMAWNPYVDFALHRDVNARQWAALDMTFASSSVCAKCHTPESLKLSVNPHQNIGCQSCHGALLAHSASSTLLDSTVKVDVPTDAVCVRCHAAATGRPADFKQIVPANHYVSQCLQCHDPHSAKANRPPVVQHPLDNLPPCLTCHGPDGFKARNQRHPSGQLTDQECLLCHAPGRGPDSSPDPGTGTSPDPGQASPGLEPADQSGQQPPSPVSP